jgi:tetratricopeptide (TPR) repeat protein
LYEQALSALDRISTAQSRIEDAIDLRLALHLPLALLAEYDRIDTTLAEAERLAEALADSERLAAVVGFQAYARFIRADYPRALDLIWRAVAMPRPHPPLPTADLFVGIILYHTGAYHPALTALTEAHAHHRTVLQASTIAFYEVLALIELGDYEAALTRTDRAFRLSEELDHHFSRALATASGGLIALGKGEADTAIHLLERAVGLCVEGQYRVALPYVTAGLGSAYLLAGRAADALEVLHEAVRHGLPTHARCSLSLGEACLHAGRAEEARHLFERSLATAHGNGERGTQARSLWLLGEIAARSEPEITEGTEGRYREALALATELGMRPLVASCHLGLGTLYRRRGKGPDSLEHLSMAAAMYRQMNMRPGLEQAMAELRNAAT